MKELQGAEISTKGANLQNGGVLSWGPHPGVIITSHHIHPVISYFNKTINTHKKQSLWGSKWDSHKTYLLFLFLSMYITRRALGLDTVLRMRLATTTCQIKSSQSNKMSLEESNECSLWLLAYSLAMDDLMLDGPLADHRNV